MADNSEPECSETSRYEALLAERGVLVADGAMGTTLFSMGLEGGGCPEMLNVEQPDMIEKVHRRFIDAGADIILTNTFGGTRRRLKLHRLEDRVDELNRRAVAIGRRAAELSDREVIVAASIGPTGDLFEPLGPLSHDEGVDVFAEQMAAVVDEGADVIWIETLSSFEELNAAVDAAAAFDVPVSATMSFDTKGRTMMGITAAQLGEWWLAQSRLGQSQSTQSQSTQSQSTQSQSTQSQSTQSHSTPSRRPVSVGANCGIGPGDGVGTVFDLTRVAPDVVAVTKANCGLPLYETDRLVYPVGPDQMGEYVELAIRSGARVIGTCCGSTPDHTAAIRAAVDAGVPGRRPDRAEIEQRLDAHGDAVPVARRTGRRRG